MWSREGLRSTQSMYSSTPHLFVYQPSSDYDDSVMMSSYDCDGASSVSGSNNTEPSDSGYADSQQSSDVMIYCNNSEREKDAVRRLSQKFIVKQQETNNNPTTTMSSNSSCSGSDDVADVTVSAAPDQLTELELLRVETFFRGNRTQVFVGKSLANL